MEVHCRSSRCPQSHQALLAQPLAVETRPRGHSPSVARSAAQWRSFRSTGPKRRRSSGPRRLQPTTSAASTTTTAASVCSSGCTPPLLNGFRVALVFCLCGVRFYILSSSNQKLGVLITFLTRDVHWLSPSTRERGKPWLPDFADALRWPNPLATGGPVPVTGAVHPKFFHPQLSANRLPFVKHTKSVPLVSGKAYVANGSPRSVRIPCGSSGPFSSIYTLSEVEGSGKNWIRRRRKQFKSQVNNDSLPSLFR